MPDTPDVRAQVWAVKFGDLVVELRDLPVRILAQVARETGHTLFEVVGGPFAGDGTQLDPIVRAAAEWVDSTVTLPEPFTFKHAVEYFTLVDDDLPEPVEIPEDAAGPPTGPAT